MKYVKATLAGKLLPSEKKIKALARALVESTLFVKEKLVEDYLRFNKELYRYQKGLIVNGYYSYQMKNK